VFDAMEAHSFGITKLHGQWRPIEIWHRNQLSTRVAHAPARPGPTEETDVAQLIQDLLAVYMLAYPGRVTLEGGEVSLPASAAAKLRLALYELAANALTVGALASPQGTLTVKWRVSANGSRRLLLGWTEHGMSGLAIPDKIGRGTQVLARTVENYVRNFAPTGMQCSFELSF
jgi:two-component sensor histidine kinase